MAVVIIHCSSTKPLVQYEAISLVTF